MHAAAGIFATLFQHRWTVPILAEMHRRGGAVRYAELVHGLSMSRESLRRTLNAMLDLHLVQRNAGYGHPLRPEYLLTQPGGTRLGPPSHRLAIHVAQRDLTTVAFRKWSLAIVWTIGRGATRFGRIAAGLPGITPRALVQGLQQLMDAGLVARAVVDEYPPSAEYNLTDAGEELLPLLRALIEAAQLD